MKKLIIYMILCLISLKAHCQFEKGKYFTGFDYSQNYVLPEMKGVHGAWSSIVGIPTDKNRPEGIKLHF